MVDIKKYTEFPSKSLFSTDCCYSVIKLCPTLWDAMDCSTPGSLSSAVSQSLLKFISIEWVMLSNYLILCHPFLLLPSIFPSIRVFFQRVGSSHQVAKVLELQLQQQSFQWKFRVESPLIFSTNTAQQT